MGTQLSFQESVGIQGVPYIVPCTWYHGIKSNSLTLSQILLLQPPFCLFGPNTCWSYHSDLYFFISPACCAICPATFVQSFFCLFRPTFLQTSLHPEPSLTFPWRSAPYYILSRACVHLVLELFLSFFHLCLTLPLGYMFFRPGILPIYS